MKYRTRTYYTDAQKAMMWERWKQGWTLHQIAHLFDRAHGSIRGIGLITVVQCWRHGAERPTAQTARASHKLCVTSCASSSSKTSPRPPPTSGRA